MFLDLSPMKSLFQIARMRRTNRIFITNEVNIVMNLLTPTTLILENHDKTHMTASVDPKRHLIKGVDQTEQQKTIGLYH